MLLFKDIKLEKAEFDQMAPALRTEAVLLSMERGNTPSDIAKALGQSISEINRVAAEKHELRLAGPAFDVEQKTGSAPAAIPDRPRLSKTATTILRLVVDAGDKGLPASTDTLARAVGVGSRHVTTSMNRLIVDDLVYRLRPPHGTAPTVWAATAIGKSVNEGVRHAGH